MQRTGRQSSSPPTPTGARGALPLMVESRLLRQCPWLPRAPAQKGGRPKGRQVVSRRRQDHLGTTKLVLSLCPLFPQGSNERETLRQFVLFLPQLLHAAGLRHQDVESSSALIAQGKWRQVWRMALARAANLQAKRENNPSTARQRSATEKAKYAHKCATAGNVSKACKIVCQEMIPACSDDTVEKLRDLHPERSLNVNLENLPTPEALNAF
jgi:hypothetical protein